MKVGSDADVGAVAAEIDAAIAGVTPIETGQMFKGQRAYIIGLQSSVVALLGITWVLATALVAVVFALVVNERRRQIGVMRALGATRRLILRALLPEAAVLARLAGRRASRSPAWPSTCSGR